MILLVVILYLLALAFCGWLFWQSVKLIIRGFKQAFAPSGTNGSALTNVPGLAPVAAPDLWEISLTGWRARMIGNHIAHCATCRDDYVMGTLPLLAPETVARIIGVCEAEDS